MEHGGLEPTSLKCELYWTTPVLHDPLSKTVTLDIYKRNAKLVLRRVA